MAREGLSSKQLFDKTWRWLLIGAFIFVLFLIPFILNLIPQNYTFAYFCFLIIILTITIWLSNLNKVAFVHDYANLSDEAWKKNQLSTLSSPFMYIFQFLFGLCLIYIYYSPISFDVFPEYFLLIFGIFLVIVSVYGFIFRKKTVQRIDKSLDNSQKIQLGRSMAIAGMVLVIISEVLNKSFQISYWITLPISAIIFTVYYFIKK